MANEKYTIEQILEAIKGSSGIKATIMRRLGCNRHTVDNYLNRYATLMQAYKDEIEMIGDAAESVIIKAIRNEDVDTAKWYARVKLGHRGYADKGEQQLGEIIIRVKYGDERANGSTQETTSKTA